MSISSDEKKILDNQVKILNGLKNVRNDFLRADNLFCSGFTMLNSIKPRLNNVNNMLNNIEPLINDSTRVYGKLERIENTAVEIRNQVNRLTIANVPSIIIPDIILTIAEIENKAKSIKGKRNATSNEKDIIQNLDDIIGKLDSIKTTMEKFESNFWRVKQEIDEIDNRLKVFEISDIKNNFIQKNTFFCRTGIITIVLIFVVAGLTALTFGLLRDQLIIVYTNRCETLISLGFILIALVLAGIWALAFIYIKSRLKIDEQDNMAFRKSLDDC